ncbi:MULTISPECIES: hypothetical protein [Streptomyces]|uniref:Uncharacterized protein n=1 Tax=Streptomyces pseudovenezuelae TaxID=67350 RepID=A0A117PQ52_9ACTN|nr:MULTISPECIES: hypothetical protein [Streptomyces]KUM85310.1 hypothetical protein AQI94_25920 [Streptomyces pseudovenezuelae]
MDVRQKAERPVRLPADPDRCSYPPYRSPAAEEFLGTASPAPASRWLARVVLLLGEPMNLLDATVVEVAAPVSPGRR